MTKAPHLRHPPLVRWLLLIAGWIALAIGLIGILLPVMPTTPFLLLAATADRCAVLDGDDVAFVAPERAAELISG